MKVRVKYPLLLLMCLAAASSWGQEAPPTTNVRVDVLAATAVPTVMVHAEIRNESDRTIVVPIRCGWKSFNFLSAHAYVIEQQSPDGWKRVDFKGPLLGDIPPSYLEVPPKTTVSFVAELQVMMYWLDPKRTIRLAIRTWDKDVAERTKDTAVWVFTPPMRLPVPVSNWYEPKPGRATRNDTK